MQHVLPASVLVWLWSRAGGEEARQPHAASPALVEAVFLADHRCRIGSAASAKGWQMNKALETAAEALNCRHL